MQEVLQTLGGRVVQLKQHGNNTTSSVTWDCPGGLERHLEVQHLTKTSKQAPRRPTPRVRRCVLRCRSFAILGHGLGPVRFQLFCLDWNSKSPPAGRSCYCSYPAFSLESLPVQVHSFRTTQHCVHLMFYTGFHKKFNHHQPSLASPH